MAPAAGALYLPPMTRFALPTCALALWAAALPFAALPAAQAADASSWARSAQSQVRLIDGGRAPDARGLLAGLEIRLEPHFITYWRDPGDAGVAPTFSFAGSANLRSATVRYPAPRKLDEAGAVAFGYAGGVTFPILVEPVDPATPVDLAVRLDYAACHDICLPAHADLRLRLDGHPSSEADRVSAALAALPRPGRVGDGGPAPSIVAVTPDRSGGFTVTAALPEADGAALFVEAPELWAYAAGAPVADGPGRVMFPVKRLDAPPGAERPAPPVTLTLTAPAGAVEVSARLDGGAPKP